MSAIVRGAGGPIPRHSVVTTSMDLTDFIAPEAVLANIKAGSKKQVLNELAARAAKLTGIDEHKIFDRLLERERLGSTGVGHGVAIPHAKFEELKSVVGVVARLKKAVDFDSVDGTPVDLVFLLLAPAGVGVAHLKALARVSRLLRNRSICAKLREGKDAQAIYAVLKGSAEELAETASVAAR